MANQTERFQQIFIRNRLPLIIFFNFTVTVIGYVLALCLRFDFELSQFTSVYRLWLPLSFLLLFRTASYLFWQLNRGYWRYASLNDLTNILKAHAFSSLLFVAAIGFLRVPTFPRSVILIEFALSVLLAGGNRLLVRVICERYLAIRSSAKDLKKEVLIIGAGDSGHLLVKYLLDQTRIPYSPVAVLDDSKRLVGSNVHGVKVFGALSSLEQCLEKYPRIVAVFVAIPSLSKARLQEIAGTCKHLGVQLKRLQSFEDIALTDAVHQTHGVSIESVLEKEIHVEHEQEIREALTGKHVLVTGAGGTIGSELVRQILPFGPRSVVLFDHGEFSLFSIEQELRDEFPEVTKHFVLGSICDKDRLVQVFQNYRPEIIFHAAAYKHLPIIENNCYEGFVNNIIGTRNLLEVSRHSEVKRFVLISTDKAVNPSSIMGCSKRIAELLVAEFSNGTTDKDKPHMSCSVVRFGNVINSTGSVIPLFKEQILSGGPVTVTHPEMERYFMSVREAVRLVLTAGTLGQEGEVFVLDMGQPIKIIDVAQKMLALYGRRDIPIVFTGIRPGEKLTERLSTSFETTAPTRLSKVNRILNPYRSDNTETIRWVAETQEQLGRISEVELAQRVLRFVEKTSRAQRESRTLSSRKISKRA